MCLTRILSIYPHNPSPCIPESFLLLCVGLFLNLQYLSLRMASKPARKTNFGLTNSLYSLTIIFLDLHVILLLIMPRVLFACFIASLHCSENLQLLSTIIPRSFSIFDCRNFLLSSMYSYWLFFCPMWITTHFSKLNCICQSFDH